MDVRWMKAFIAVAEELNFGRAAQRLHLAQPAVTAQIASLEKYLGVKVFDRNNRGVRLTDAGAAFLDPCRTALRAIDAAAMRARNSGTGEHGRLRIGFNVGFSIDPLVPLTRAVRGRYPHLDLEIDIPRLNTDIVRLVQSEDLQFGLVGGPLTGEGVAQRLVAMARLCAVVPRDHPLAELTEVSVSRLRDQPFVLATSGPGTLRYQVERACEQSGFLPSEVTDVPDVSGVLALVAAGVGIGFTMSTSRVLQPSGLVMVPLIEPDHVETLLIWKAGRETGSLRNVLQLAEEVFAGVRPGGRFGSEQ